MPALLRQGLQCLQRQGRLRRRSDIDRKLLADDGASGSERRVRTVVKLREKNMELFDRYYREGVEHLLKEEA